MLAVAVFAIVAGGFAIWPWETSSQKAFAQLQEAVRGLNSLVFALTSYTGDEASRQFQVTYTKSGDVRMDSGLPRGLAMVAELDDKGQLKLPMRLVPADPPQMIGAMQYLSLGLQIEVSSVKGVEWMRCYESGLKWKRFAGSSSHGIKIGMSKQEANAILEKEESVSKDLNQVDDRWLLNGMDIVFEKDKCVEIAIGTSNFSNQQ